MSFTKVGGKAIIRKKVIETMEELTAGYMQLDGSVVSSTAYSYSQKIEVKSDDVIWLKNGSNGTHSTYRRIVAFNGTTAIETLGYDTGAYTNAEYIVPEGVDGVVLVGTNTAQVIVRETGDAYSKVLMFNEDGAVLESHIWNGDITQIVNEEIRSTSGFGRPTYNFDVSGYAIHSLRINNTLNQAVNFKFFQDDTLGSTHLKSSDGTEYGFSVPANTSGVIVTADDIPILNYLVALRLFIKCETAPTSGSLEVYLVSRR